MISALTLVNFKAWEALDDLQLGKITGFFGTNSSGKTSILQALLLARRTAESPDRRAVLAFGDDSSPESLGGYRDVIHKHETERTLRLGLRWTSGLRVHDPEQVAPRILFAPDHLHFETQVGQDEKGLLQVENFEYSLDLNGRDVVFGMKRHDGKYGVTYDGYELKRPRGRPPTMPAPNRFFGFPDRVRSAFQNAGFLTDLELDLEDRLQGVHYLGPLRERPRREYKWSGSDPADMGQRGELAIHAMLASRRKGPTISKGGGATKADARCVCCVALA